jgi:predicted ATPase
VKSKCIKALETHQNINLTEPLQIAMKEGLVSKVAGSYHFSHDWIQETCYSFVNHQDRALNHLTYGRCLSKLAQETNNDDMMFTSANQINLGGPEAITDANECITMASFNLMVGKKAIETSDFSLAHKLFSSGIKFLPQQHWRYHYDISLELYELAAKAALATSNIDEIPLLSETVLKHARCFDDELNIHQIVILSLMQTSKLNEALEMGMNVLSQLGEGISRNQLDLLFYLDVKRTQAMISGLTEDAVLGYRPMTDKKKQAAMKILSCIHRCSFLALAAPPLCRCIILKMVQVTIKKGENTVWLAILQHCKDLFILPFESLGLSNQSPIAFALFGVLLSTMGKIPVGRRFSLLAMALLNKLESKEYAGEVMYLVARVSCLVEPFQAVIDLHTRAELASLVAGDVQHACINRGTRSVIKFSTGAKLEDVNRGISQALLVVKMQEFNTVLFLLMTFQWLVLVLMGNEADADLNARASEQNDTNPRQLMLA